MFVYHKIYKKPVSPIISTPQCGDKGKMAIPGIEVVREMARSVCQVCFLNKRPPPLLANRYLISQPLLSQPQLAPHKHETEVVSPQYTLHWQKEASVSTSTDRSLCEPQDCSLSLCLGSSGTRALGNASLSVLAKKFQEGSEHPQLKHTRALTVHAPLPNRQHKECVYPHPWHNAHPKTLLLLARHNARNDYWQTTPNKTRTVSNRALVKTQKAASFGQAL